MLIYPKHIKNEVIAVILLILWRSSLIYAQNPTIISPMNKSG